MSADQKLAALSLMPERRMMAVLTASTDYDRAAVLLEMDLSQREVVMAALPASARISAMEAISSILHHRQLQANRARVLA